MKNENGKFYVETGGGYFFDTAEKAENWENNLRKFWAVMEVVPAQISDEQYREICNTHGLKIMDMKGDRYGIEYGEFKPSQGWMIMAQYAIAHRRLMTIKSEPKPAPKSHQHDYPDGRKLNCGCTVYDRSEVMSASLGSSCSDCYDRMSG